MGGHFSLAGYLLTRSGSGGHAGGSVWADEMLLTKLVMGERGIENLSEDISKQRLF